MKSPRPPGFAILPMPSSASHSATRVISVYSPKKKRPLRRSQAASTTMSMTARCPGPVSRPNVPALHGNTTISNAPSRSTRFLANPDRAGQPGPPAVILPRPKSAKATPFRPTPGRNTWNLFLRTAPVPTCFSDCTPNCVLSLPEKR